jgi:aminoglycoside phosphotransferase
MDERERAQIVRKSQRVSSLSANDVHELKNILRVGLQPFANDVKSVMARADRDDDAVLLKAALQGESSMSKNERLRLDEAITKRGRRIPG